MENIVETKKLGLGLSLDLGISLGLFSYVDEDNCVVCDGLEFSSIMTEGGEYVFITVSDASNNKMEMCFEFNYDLTFNKLNGLCFYNDDKTLRIEMLVDVKGNLINDIYSKLSESSIDKELIFNDKNVLDAVKPFIVEQDDFEGLHCIDVGELNETINLKLFCDINENCEIEDEIEFSSHMDDDVLFVEIKDRNGSVIIFDYMFDFKTLTIDNEFGLYFNNGEGFLELLRSSEEDKFYADSYVHADMVTFNGRNILETMKPFILDTDEDEEEEEYEDLN